MKSYIKSYLKYFYENQYLINQLIKKNVVAQYKKTKLGLFWSLAEPMLNMSVLYLVFGIGLRGGRSMEIPFICYLVVGVAVVSLFNSVLNKGASLIRSQSYLLKKIKFRMSSLPFILVIAQIVDHLFFFVAVIAIILVNGIMPHWYWFQTIYYLFGLSILMLGITWTTSSLGVIIPDLNNIVSVLNRLFFYFSPVFWDINHIPPGLRKYLALNPLYYIITGYRNSLFYKVPFWEDTRGMIIFWGITVFFLVTGAYVFRKLRPHFSDLV